MKRENRDRIVKGARRCCKVLSMWLLLGTVLLASCTEEISSDGRLGSGESVPVTLQLLTPESFSAPQSFGTRAVTDDQIIKDGMVIVFDKLDKVILSQTLPSIHGAITIELPTSRTPADLFDIVVIANPNGMTIPAIGTSKSVVVSNSSIDAVYWQDKETVPMWGEAENVLIHRETNSFQFRMLRSLARIDVGVGEFTPDVNNSQTGKWAGLSNFKLTGVRIYNNKLQALVIPKSDNIDFSLFKAKLPTEAGGALDGSNRFFTANDDTHCSSRIFIGEKNNISGNAPTMIFLRGTYNGITTHYKLSLTMPENGASKQHDVLRNHLYRFTIREITAIGESNIDKLASTAPMNDRVKYELTVIDGWQSVGDATFDGTSSIQLDASNVYVYSDTPGIRGKYPVANARFHFNGLYPIRMRCNDLFLTVDGTEHAPGTDITIPNAFNSGKSFPIIVRYESTSAKTTQIVFTYSGTKTKAMNLTLKPALSSSKQTLECDATDVFSVFMLEPFPWLTLSCSGTTETSYDYLSGINLGTVYFNVAEYTKGTTLRSFRAVASSKGKGGTTKILVEQKPF